MDTTATDHLLTTTRAVRKRLDLERPVERSVIEDCLRIAIQAPTGRIEIRERSEVQPWGSDIIMALRTAEILKMCFALLSEVCIDL